MDKLIARSTVSQQFVDSNVFPIRADNLQISELPLAGIIRVQGRTADDAFRSQVASCLGADLPAAERTSVGADVRIAWTGPNEYLCFCALAAEEKHLSALTDALAGQFATVTLVSDSRVAFLVTGREAQAFISKGCSIDMNPASFPADRAVTTRFAGLPAMLMHRGGGDYVIYFDIGYVEFVVKWMLDAAEEFLEPAA
ncbi:sarcosine oxidase subunit gamma [Burkholderia cenocepacia]|uniref:sarcosine oxidase subunit gamma n=1 Tax=Burkholderia cenocepacia TaxID=95486 RepID=UPI002B242C25|nr:sarcosine oxidase subunit gamma family protein [Burkholderia cenocepacia]MEB2543756.1 sarcosine oxidase subunit gamma family protein [Burkholderia cenocepacia]